MAKSSARILDETPVKMGHAIPVENTERKFGESFMYYAVKFENQSGTDEFWCMFTENELKSLTRCELESTKPDKKPGRLYYRHRVGKCWMNFVDLVVPGKGTKSSCVQDTFRICDSLLEKGRKRYAKNPEDQPKMGWLEDLKD